MQPLPLPQAHRLRSGELALLHTLVLVASRYKPLSAQEAVNRMPVSPSADVAEEGDALEGDSSSGNEDEAGNASCRRCRRPVALVVRTLATGAKFRALLLSAVTPLAVADAPSTSASPLPLCSGKGGYCSAAGSGPAATRARAAAKPAPLGKVRSTPARAASAGSPGPAAGGNASNDRLQGASGALAAPHTSSWFGSVTRASRPALSAAAVATSATADTAGTGRSGRRSTLVTAVPSTRLERARAHSCAAVVANSPSVPATSVALARPLSSKLRAAGGAPGASEDDSARAAAAAAASPAAPLQALLLPQASGTGGAHCPCS